jgi:hypothetical protein
VKQGQPIITTSFSSKSEGSLHLSLDGHYVTYMGYTGAAGLEGVSNSETTNPNAQIAGATGPFYDRAVALVKYDRTVTLTIEDVAYSGDNPRGAITLDGKEFYMAGNADSTTNAGGTTGPGLTIGAPVSVCRARRIPPSSGRMSPATGRTNLRRTMSRTITGVASASSPTPAE